MNHLDMPANFNGWARIFKGERSLLGVENGHGHLYHGEVTWSEPSKPGETSHLINVTWTPIPQVFEEPEEEDYV